jgi:branched-chain amino acid transport system substrate-binding protein
LAYDSGMGPATMRKDDHQLLLPMLVSTMETVGSDGVKNDVEGSGFGFKTEVELPAEKSTLPTSCQMKRPAK